MAIQIKNDNVLISHIDDLGTKYLPLTGGTMTGYLTILGNAADHLFKTRGIWGINPDGTDGDLYIGYNNGTAHSYVTRFGYDGGGSISADGKTYSGLASLNLPLTGGTLTGALTFNQNNNISTLGSYADGLSVNNFFQIVSKAKTGCEEQHVIFLPHVPYGLIDSTHTNETYAKAWIKWICTNYPGYNNTIFLGMFHPNSQGMCIGEIYSTSQKNSSGYPQYCDFLALQCANNLITFGFNNYTWYYKTR